jgi:hypothetical protein
VRRTAIRDIISQCTAEKFLSGVSDGFNVGLLIELAASRLAIPSEEVFDEDIARGRAVLP